MQERAGWLAGWGPLGLGRVLSVLGLRLGVAVGAGSLQADAGVRNERARRQWVAGERTHHITCAV